MIGVELGAGGASAAIMATPETGGASLSGVAPSIGVAIYGTAVSVKGATNLITRKGHISETSSNENSNSSKKVRPKKEAREAAKEKRDSQPASEKYAKDKAKAKAKAEGPDARRKAHDAKEKGAPDRTKKQIDEDYKINR